MSNSLLNVIRNRLFLVIFAGIFLLSGCGMSEKQNADNSSKLEIEESTDDLQELELEERKVQEVSTDSGEEKMDEKTQKMMAEGVTSDETKTEGLAEGADGETVINGYNISIMCPLHLTKKKEGVEYGELIHTSYYSKTCEKDRNVNILLPANYNAEKKYPVLYILHGIFGDEYSMIGDENSGIPFTLGNMMNEGLMKEAIVVFPFMYASKDRDQCTAIDIENVLAYDNFVNDLVDDLMPFLAKNYSILEGKDSTAITGFSMGGREAIAIGFYRPDLFGYVGSIAPAPGLIPSKDYAMEHPGQFEENELVYESEKPYVVMMCCGDDDKVVGTFPKVYHELFERNKVDHVWWEVPGSDHGDPAISSGIYNFAKVIFSE